MIRTKTPLLVLCALALLSAPALAGPLAVDTNSYLGIWHSSTPYQGYFDPPDNTDPSGLSGYIDWAVYAPGAFPVGFTGENGWSPAIDEYVYTYQLYETDPPEGVTPAPASQFIMTVVDDSANNIGEFSGDGGFGQVGGNALSILADDLAISVDDGAQWYWYVGIDSGYNSYGLAFTSPNPPMLSDGTTIDDGTFGFVVPVPTPQGANVPEPGTLTLVTLGFAGLALGWLRRRKRRG